MNGNVRAIRVAVDRWREMGSFDPSIFDTELAYFVDRYCPGGEFNHHFEDLLMRPSDQKARVRSVLSGHDIDPLHRVATALIIVYRYRNNLFHGPKWTYELSGQLNNFNAANGILMKALDRHGEFG